MLRRGLPRVRGGEPWPEAGAVDSAASAIVAPESGAVPASASVVESAAVPEPAPVPESAAVADSASVPESAAVADSAGVPASASVPAPVDAPSATRLRRGLPRVAGGDPWPAADSIRATSSHPRQQSMAQTQKSAADAAAREPAASPATPATATPTPATAAAAPTPAAAAAATGDAATLRRGLPRVDGGEPWPPAGSAARVTSTPPAADIPGSANAPAEVAQVITGAVIVEDAAGEVTDELVGSVIVERRGPDISAPLPFRRTVWNGVAPRHDPPADEAPASRKRPTWVQVIAGLFAAAGLGVLAAAVVALVRAVLSSPVMQDFLLAYPGEYEPAVHVEPGFAPWVGWQHFFNMFLMILIIRSGLRVRTEKRPTAFWTPKGSTKGKISLTLWFHQALDLLWIINGVIFVVLLFATGHWARIVPTSWEVIPNAISAGLQYVSLDWPHENGWNNYNSLQQLAYFATVFLAAPLAIITGFRMSGLWPKKAEKLSKAYPIEWARAVHFPVMLYFVAFIIVHVALVVFTGFLANLGHMYASTDVLGWTGFWVFLASLVVIAIGWWAARPLVIAPIAKLFGTVTAR